MDKLERFKGCMLGGATGDALGYVIEFDSLNAIRRKYGPHGLRTILKSKKDGNKAVISDDTQLALFTADGLLWAAEDGVDSVDRVFRSYMRWYYTQTERIVKPEQKAWMLRQPHEDKWGYDLMDTASLYVRRAPGKTCLQSLAMGISFAAHEVPNSSKSGGAVKRAAPVGLFYSERPEEAFRVGCETAFLTHGGSEAVVTTGSYCLLIALLSKGLSLREALPQVITTAENEAGGELTAERLRMAVTEAESDRVPVDSIKRLTDSKHAAGILAVAVYCILKTDSLRHAVIMSCNHDDDSNSCGTVCGSLAGTIYGAGAIPEGWLNTLECFDLLVGMSHSLYEAV